MIEDMDATLADIRQYMDEYKIKGDLLLIHDDNNNQFEGGRGYKLIAVENIQEDKMREKIQECITALTSHPSHFRQKYSFLFQKDEG